MADEKQTSLKLSDIDGKGKTSKEITTKDDEVWWNMVDEVGFGDESVDSSSIIFPRMKIIQPSTREKGDAKDGDILEVVSNKNYGNNVQVVPLVIWKSRVLFTKEFGLRCRSKDGEVGAEGEFAGKSCATCPLSQWGKDGERPECHLTYNFAVAELEELKYAIDNKVVLPPLILTMSGTSSKTARQIATALRMMTRKNKKPIFAFAIDLSTEKGKSDKGNYFIYTAKIKSLDSGFAPYLFELFKQYKSMKIDTTEAIKDEVGSGTVSAPKIDNELDV